MPPSTIPARMRAVLRHPLETAICALLIAMTGVVFSQVVARYILHAPLSWSEELARFLLMWLSMLSAAYAFKTKSHFALQLLVSSFSPELQRRIGVFVQLIVIFFFATLLYFSVVFVIGVNGHIAPAMQIPMELPYASIVVGNAIILAELIRSAWREMTGRTVNKKD